MSAMYKPVHPGRIIRDDYLEPLELTVKQMADSLKISRQTLTAILNERAGVTPEMALRLSEAFDTSAELWINLQRAYDLALARKKFSLKGTIKRLYSADVA
jgi:addiction module HigA family antidote